MIIRIVVSKGLYEGQLNSKTIHSLIAHGRNTNSNYYTKDLANFIVALEIDNIDSRFSLYNVWSLDTY